MVCPTGPGSPFDTARGKPGSCEPCEHGVEILLEAREGRIEQLSAWDDHEIDPAERQRRHISENHNEAAVVEIFKNTLGLGCKGIKC